MAPSPQESSDVLSPTPSVASSSGLGVGKQGQLTQCQLGGRADNSCGGRSHKPSLRTHTERQQRSTSAERLPQPTRDSKEATGKAQGAGERPSSTSRVRTSSLERFGPAGKDHGKATALEALSRVGSHARAGGLSKPAAGGDLKPVAAPGGFMLRLEKQAVASSGQTTKDPAEVPQYYSITSFGCSGTLCAVRHALLPELCVVAPEKCYAVLVLP